MEQDLMVVEEEKQEGVLEIAGDFVNYNCPYCGEDLDRYTEKNNISPYGTIFICPFCKKSIKAEYEESYDGQEEYNYYWLEKVEM